MNNYKEYKTVQQYANAAARWFGYGQANHIIVCNMEYPNSKFKMVHHTDYGFRKKTTITVIGISKEVAKHFGII